MIASQPMFVGPKPVTPTLLMEYDKAGPLIIVPTLIHGLGNFILSWMALTKVLGLFRHTNHCPTPPATKHQHGTTTHGPKVLGPLQGPPPTLHHQASTRHHLPWATLSTPTDQKCGDSLHCPIHGPSPTIHHQASTGHHLPWATSPTDQKC